ncbi:uncharacterized protein LOC130785126 [Actinidia eriantha]|uniref:uncharacterized protein LOC130785126 n=1 Tax=Actinidia eriantha TaxID=165200 RepID=UPI002583AD75|nr:uncharacterized protein LOC130785126 [Actinidia eriantha]
MEVSVIGSSQAKIGRVDWVHRDVGFCGNLSTPIFSRKSKICSGQTIRWPLKSPILLTVKAAVQSEALVFDKVTAKSKPVKKIRARARLDFEDFLLDLASFDVL